MPRPEHNLARGQTKHYPILDALRFILAFWVAIGHFGNFPLFAGVNSEVGFGRFITHAWNSVVFGTPAVIVFFVISGFCIHLPFIGNERLSIWRYYFRRYTRILIPVAGALCVYRLSGQHLVLWGEDSVLWHSPLWSLACEEIYYAAYPLLRLARNRLEWKKLLPLVFIAGIATALTHPHSVTWYDFGPFGTALILLPVWLLGCLLAEQGNSILWKPSVKKIWGWRFLIWFACWTSEMLHFKAGIPYTQTMIWFGVLAYFWIREEIAFGKYREPDLHLVKAGRWSYSLYLVHASGMMLFSFIPNLGYSLNWIGTMSCSLGFSYLFYILVEAPSHRLARRVQVFGRSQAGPTEVIAKEWSPLKNVDTAD